MLPRLAIACMWPFSTGPCEGPWRDQSPEWHSQSGCRTDPDRHSLEAAVWTPLIRCGTVLHFEQIMPPCTSHYDL